MSIPITLTSPPQACAETDKPADSEYSEMAWTDALVKMAELPTTYIDIWNDALESDTATLNALLWNKFFNTSLVRGYMPLRHIVTLRERRMDYAAYASGDTVFAGVVNRLSLTATNALNGLFPFSSHDEEAYALALMMALIKDPWWSIMLHHSEGNLRSAFRLLILIGPNATLDRTAPAYLDYDWAELDLTQVVKFLNAGVAPSAIKQSILNDIDVTLAASLMDA